MKKKCCYISYGPHLIFFHDSYRIKDTFLNTFINIPYQSKLDNDIIICPPSILNINFNKSIKREILVSFKGVSHRKSVHDNIDYRNLIMKTLKKFETEKIIIEDSDSNKNSYVDLLYNSIFSVIIEGDVSWSYRITEVINSGSIPIVILPKHENILPFQQILDYSKFSILLHYHEIDNFFTNILHKLDDNYIKFLQDNLYHVNQRVFLNRTTQINSLLNCIEYKFSNNTFIQ